MPLSRAPRAARSADRGGIFYGWVIVGSFFLFNALGQASGTLNFGLFVIPISEELGLSRQMIGWAQTARLWAGGLSGIVIGRWLDRHGPRVPVLVAGVAAVAGLLILSRAQSAGMLFGVLLALGASGWTAPGGGALIATVPVSKWFVRLRGRATGIVQLGLGVGGALLLPLTQSLIGSHGWRSALVTLAWLSAAVLPLTVLLRRQPGDLGLLPDGGPPRRRRSSAAGASRRRAPPADDDPRWTLAAAIRTAAMWKLTGAFAILGFLLGAASVHRVPHWVELGFSPATVSYAFGIDAAVATVTALAAGFVVERLAVRFVGAISCVLFCAAIALMTVGQAWLPLAARLRHRVRCRDRAESGGAGGDLGAVLRLALRRHDPWGGAADHGVGGRVRRAAGRFAARRDGNVPRLVDDRGGAERGVRGIAVERTAAAAAAATRRWVTAGGHPPRGPSDARNARSTGCRLARCAPQ